jgi:hypothetical protein
MWLSNCSLKGTRATQLPRNLSHQFQDWSPLGHRLLIFLPRHVLRACLSTEEGPIEVQALSQSPRRKTYLVSRRLRQWLHPIEESERGSCLSLRQSWFSDTHIQTPISSLPFWACWGLIFLVDDQNTLPLQQRSPTSKSRCLGKFQGKYIHSKDSM